MRSSPTRKKKTKENFREAITRQKYVADTENYK